MKTLVYIAAVALLTTCAFSYAADEAGEGGGKGQKIGRMGDGKMKGKGRGKNQENRKERRGEWVEFLKSIKDLDATAKVAKIKEFMSKQYEEREAQSKAQQEKRMIRLKEMLSKREVSEDKQTQIIADAEATQEKVRAFHKKQHDENVEFVVALIGKELEPKAFHEALKAQHQKQMEENKAFHETVRKELQQKRQEFGGKNKGGKKGRKGNGQGGNGPVAAEE